MFSDRDFLPSLYILFKSEVILVLFSTLSIYFCDKKVPFLCFAFPFRYNFQRAEKQTFIAKKVRNIGYLQDILM